MVSPWRRLSNSLGPVWASMHSDFLSTTTVTPAGIDIDVPVRIEGERPGEQILEEKTSLWDNLLLSSHFFGCSSLSKMCVIKWTRYEI